MGIGYFADGNEKYPLNHFIDELNRLSFTGVFEDNSRSIYDFLKRISIQGDTGNYVKGIMAGFMKHQSFVCLFNRDYHE